MTEPRIALVGEAFGEKEAEEGRPFIGASGRFLNYCLNVAGIQRKDCYCTNVFNFRPMPKPGRKAYPPNNLRNICGKKFEGIPNRIPLMRSMYVLKEYESELTRLYKELDTYDPDLTIALGNTAIWALLGANQIRKVRGAAHVGYAGRKVLPTYHPSAVLRQYTLFPVFIADLQKARKESYFRDVRRPQRFIHIEPGLDDLYQFERDYIRRSPDLSIDIETAGDQITEIGFAPTIDRAIVIPFLDESKPDKNYWPSLEVELSAWAWVRRMCGLRKSRVVGQNFNYDMKFLLGQYGIPVPAANHDTMLLHHALQPEMEKNLGFMASVYTDELAWKFMRTEKGTTVKKED